MRKCRVIARRLAQLGGIEKQGSLHLDAGETVEMMRSGDVNGKINPWTAVLVCLLATTFAAPSAGSQSLSSAPKAQGAGCANAESQWDRLKTSLDVLALQRFIDQAPPTCQAQKSAAQKQLSFAIAENRRRAEQQRTADQQRAAAAQEASQQARVRSAVSGLLGTYVSRLRDCSRSIDSKGYYMLTEKSGLLTIVSLAWMNRDISTIDQSFPSAYFTDDALTTATLANPALGSEIRVSGPDSSLTIVKGSPPGWGCQGGENACLVWLKCTPANEAVEVQRQQQIEAEAKRIGVEGRYKGTKLMTTPFNASNCGNLEITVRGDVVYIRSDEGLGGDGRKEAIIENIAGSRINVTSKQGISFLSVSGDKLSIDKGWGNSQYRRC